MAKKPAAVKPIPKQNTETPLLSKPFGTKTTKSDPSKTATPADIPTLTIPVHVETDAPTPEQLFGLSKAKCYYDLDRYLFDEVTMRFEKDRTLNSFDFYAIITWKANRAKTKVRSGLKSVNLSPATLMERVYGIAGYRQKMKALEVVPGIGIPIASAILTVCYPKRFTVIDYRAWETLLDLKRVSSKTMPTGIDGYFKRYLPVCARLALEMKLSLRDLDLALWGWSQRKSIEKIATS